MAAETEKAGQPSQDALRRASNALKHFVFKGGRSEHQDAEIAVAREIDEAVKESRK